LLELGEAALEFLLFLGLQDRAHGPYIRVQALDGHGRNPRLQLAIQKTPADVVVLFSESPEFGHWTATAPSLAALGAVPPALLGMVWVVDVAPLGVVNRYPLAGGTSLRYARTLGH